MYFVTLSINSGALQFHFSLQQICRLLAVMHVISASIPWFSLTRINEVDDRHLAAFFHQASVGSHISQKKRALPLPESISDLAEYVENFSARLRLAPTTVVNISMLGGEYAYLLDNLLGGPKHSAWILVSRFSSKDEPVVMLRPVHSISQGI